MSLVVEVVAGCSKRHLNIRIILLGYRRVHQKACIVISLCLGGLLAPSSSRCGGGGGGGGSGGGA